MCPHKPRSTCRLTVLPPRSSGDSGDSGSVAEVVNETNTPFAAAFFTLSPGGGSRLDQHAVREVWLVVAGCGLLEWRGATIRLTAGSAVAFAPHESHRVTAIGAMPLVLVSIWWEARQ